MVVDDIGVLPKPRIQGFLAKVVTSVPDLSDSVPSEESEGRVPATLLPSAVLSRPEYPGPPVTLTLHV